MTPPTPSKLAQEVAAKCVDLMREAFRLRNDEKAARDAGIFRSIFESAISEAIAPLERERDQAEKERGIFATEVNVVRDKQRAAEAQLSSLSLAVEHALNVLSGYGGIDGEHHKRWVLDQVVRILTGDKYPEWVTKHNAGEDGPNTYEWDEGVAP